MFRLTQIVISSEEQRCIENLINMIDSFPMELNDKGYLRIFRAISQKEPFICELNTDYDSIEIKYGGRNKKMTEEAMQKLAFEISEVANTCQFCPIRKECGESLYGTCDGVWYEHISKLNEKIK